MEILNTTSFINQPYTSDAHIFSTNQVRKEDASNLLYAQLVAEAQWLDGFPTFAIPWQPSIQHFTRLYEDIKLIHPDSWEIIDKTDTFLLNSKMYELCRDPNHPFPNTINTTSDELQALFSTQLFAIVCAGTEQDR